MEISKSHTSFFLGVAQFPQCIPVNFIAVVIIPHQNLEIASIIILHAPLEIWNTDIT
jgi:hypothetical protein